MIRAAGLAGLVVGMALPAAAIGPLDLARCAGVADAIFDDYEANQETHLLDDLAFEAHVFFALAWDRADGNDVGLLHAARRDARAATFADGRTDDDVHTDVQACSDLRQAMGKRFRLP